MGERRSLLDEGWSEGFRTIGGLRLHVVEAGEPGSPLLILLHGFPEFWWAWRRQITAFAQGGFHVVVPDMRGYNASDAPQEIAAYALDRLAGDVTELADSLGAARFHLVGHDWGAIVAWWTAARHPARVARAVALAGPHPDVWSGVVRRHPAQALRSGYVAFFQLPFVPEATLAGFGFAGLRAAMKRSARGDAFEPDAFERYAEAWAMPGRLTAMLNYYRALRLHSAVGEPVRVKAPMLILWGGDDAFLERGVADASLALCDDGRLEILEGTSHWLHLEEPRLVNGRILDFLRSGR